MTDDMARRAAERRTRQRVEQELGLAVHRLVHLAVNTGLVIAAGGPAGPVRRPAGWGVGLAAPTAYVSGDLGRLRERLVRRESARERAW
jgi:hypothetical protein